MHALSLPFLHHWPDAGRFLLRLIAGLVISAHGMQKIQGGVENFAGFVGSLGLPLPTATAYLVTGLELVGGILLIVGLLSRLGGLLLALEMIGTTLLVKVDLGLIPAEGVGAELDLVLLAAFAGVVLLGPGRASLDAVLGIEGERRGSTAAKGKAAAAAM